MRVKSAAPVAVIGPFAGAVLDGLDDLGRDAGVDVGAVRCGHCALSVGPGPIPGGERSSAVKSRRLPVNAGSISLAVKAKAILT
jgi:hypothetical protein